MKTIFTIIFFCFAGASLRGQTINKAMLARYSRRAEQEKIINHQIVLLQMPAQQAAQFKVVSFFYIDKALATVNANINSGTYTLYRKIKPLRDEHEAVMKRLLTATQLGIWKTERKKNGIVAQLIR